MSPTIAKVLDKYIMLLENEEGDKVDVRVTRVTTDGRYVIDRGICEDANDFLLAGTFPCSFDDV